MQAGLLLPDLLGIPGGFRDSSHSNDSNPLPKELQQWQIEPFPHPSGGYRKCFHRLKNGSVEHEIVCVGLKTRPLGP